MNVCSLTKDWSRSIVLLGLRSRVTWIKVKGNLDRGQICIHCLRQLFVLTRKSRWAHTSHNRYERLWSIQGPLSYSVA